MSAIDDLRFEVADWLDTWAPNCGAPRAVFEGQFRTIVSEILNCVEDNSTDSIKDAVKRACKS